MSRDFWSRRKAGVEAEQIAETRATEEVAAEVREASFDDQTDAEILEDLGLPDPDDLVEGDDFKVFLTKAVPARIRSRALRRLWLTNPVLANVDGLVDYGEDFTDAACVLENMQTAYQVGKGMTAHVEEMARQAEAEEQDDAEHDEPPTDDPSEIENAPVLEEDDPIVMATNVPNGSEVLVFDEIEDNDALPPRRMRFAFDDAGASA